MLYISNIFSLSRIFLIPVIGYYIAQNEPSAALIALGIIILAGISDGLDGYFARKLSQISKLGLILDPLADKVMAIALVIFLIIYREFPIWLAGFIFSRDILIIIAGITILSKKSIVVPSNLTGKYAFASIVVLMSAYIIRLQVVIDMFIPIVTVLLAVSMINYGLAYAKITKGTQINPFQDKKYYRYARLLIMVIIGSIVLYKFYFHLIEMLKLTINY